MIRMKEVLKKHHGIKRLGSADCGVKKLTAVGETRWQDKGANLYHMEGFYAQAAGAIAWLIENSQGAWRYGAQHRRVSLPDNPQQKTYQLRHRVQFENTSDALLFKLSYRP